MAAIILLTCIAISCQKNVRSATYTSPEPNESPSLIFLTFKIKGDSSQASTISLVSKKVVSGSKKNTAWIPRPNYLIVQLVSSNDQVLQSDTCEHPLIRDIEYVNDAKTFERKRVNLKEADFSVRMNLPADAQSAKVTEVREQKIITSALFRLR